MKFIVALLVLAILLVAQGSYPALLMAGFVSIVGCLAVGFHASAVAQKAFRRQQRIVYNTALCDLDDLYSEMSEEDAWEAAKEDRDYMHSTGMSVEEMLAEERAIREMYGRTMNEIEADAHEKGYS